MEPEPSAAPTETRWLLGGSVGRLKKLAGMDSSADREQLPTATEKKSLLGNAGKGLGALKEVTAKAGQAAGKATKDLGSRVGQSVGLVETPEPTLLDEVGPHLPQSLSQWLSSSHRACNPGCVLA